MSKPISLHGKRGQGKFAIVDDSTFDELNRIRWNYERGYAVTTKKRRQGRGNPPICTKIYMHRLIVSTPTGLHTDHIDRDGLNNQRDNLRAVTCQKNAWNTGINRRNTSGYVGVTWSTAMKMWRAQITHNRKQIIIGYFAMKEDAARAYNTKAIEIRGDLARLNIIHNKAQETITGDLSIH